jgi:hypothetical protein
MPPTRLINCSSKCPSGLQSVMLFVAQLPSARTAPASFAITWASFRPRCTLIRFFAGPAGLRMVSAPLDKPTLQIPSLKRLRSASAPLRLLVLISPRRFQSARCLLSFCSPASFPAFDANLAHLSRRASHCADIAFYKGFTIRPSQGTRRFIPLCSIRFNGEQGR